MADSNVQQNGVIQVAKYDAKIIGNNNKGEYLIETNEKREVIKRDKLHEYVRNGVIRLTNVPIYTCIGKVRNASGAIVGYNIKRVDKSQKVETIPAKIVKANITEFKVQFDNLTLTSDNRLVDRAKRELDTPRVENKRSVQVTGHNKSQAKDEVNQPSLRIVLTRQDVVAMFKAAQKIAQSQGVSSIRLMISGQSVNAKNSQSKCVNKKYRFSWSTDDKQVISIVVSPYDEHTHIEMPADCRRLFSFTTDGSDKIDTGNVKVKMLVLSEIDWQNAINADEMFYQLNIERLVIKKSKAEKLTNMYGFCKEQFIYAVNFDDFLVPNLQRATAMFKGCENLRIEDIKLKGISLENAKFVGEMFRINKQDLQHNKELKYEGHPELGYCSKDETIRAVEGIIKNYGTRFVDFFRYAYESFSGLHNYEDYGEYIPDKDLRNKLRESVDTEDMARHYGSIIADIASYSKLIIKYSDVFKVHNDDTDTDYPSVYCYSMTALLYPAIAYCLGWKGYNKKGLNQPIDEYLFNTDVWCHFIFSPATKEAQQSQTVEEMNRSSTLGQPNRELVRKFLNYRLAIRMGENPNREYCSPVYDDQTIKAIKEIYGIDLKQNKFYLYFESKIKESEEAFKEKKDEYLRRLRESRDASYYWGYDNYYF